MASKSYIGTGKIYLKVRGSTDPARMIGNCSKLTFNISEDTKSQQNFMDCAGGEAESVSRISSVGVEINAYEFSAANLALGLYGTTTAFTAAPVVDEAHLVTIGEAIVLDHLSTGITGAKEGGVTLVEGTDYDLVDGNLVPKAAGALINGDTVLISYGRAAYSAVEALINHGEEYTLQFRGMNQANGCSLFDVDVYRMKLSPTDNLDLIGDDYGQLTLKGSVLVDSTITGAGLSKYFRVRVGT